MWGSLLRRTWRVIRRQRANPARILWLEIQLGFEKLYRILPPLSGRPTSRTNAQALIESLPRVEECPFDEETLHAMRDAGIPVDRFRL